MAEFQTIHARIAPLVVLPATIRHRLPATVARMFQERFITSTTERTLAIQFAQLVSSFLYLCLFYASFAALPVLLVLSPLRIVRIQTAQSIFIISTTAVCRCVHQDITLI